MSSPLILLTHKKQLLNVFTKQCVVKLQHPRCKNKTINTTCDIIDTSTQHTKELIMTKMTQQAFFDAIHAAETADEKFDILFSENIEIIEEETTE
jgi:hypothetical protein